jgi:hypothetical protein
MPQFDFFSFSTQVFWTLTGFFVFYFFVLKFYLVKIGQILKLRKIFKKKNFLKSTNYDCILSLIFQKN